MESLNHSVLYNNSVITSIAKKFIPKNNRPILDSHNIRPQTIEIKFPHDCFPFVLMVIDSRLYFPVKIHKKNDADRAQ